MYGDAVLVCDALVHDDYGRAPSPWNGRRSKCFGRLTRAWLGADEHRGETAGADETHVTRLESDSKTVLLSLNNCHPRRVKSSSSRAACVLFVPPSRLP